MNHFDFWRLRHCFTAATEQTYHCIIISLDWIFYRWFNGEFKDGHKEIRFLCRSSIPNPNYLSSILIHLGGLLVISGYGSAFQNFILTSSFNYEMEVHRVPYQAPCILMNDLMNNEFFVKKRKKKEKRKRNMDSEA